MVIFEGSHVIALIMLTIAPFLEGYWPVRRFALSDLRFPRHLQPGSVFPEDVSFFLPLLHNVPCHKRLYLSLFSRPCILCLVKSADKQIIISLLCIISKSADQHVGSLLRQQTVHAWQTIHCWRKQRVIRCDFMIFHDFWYFLKLNGDIFKLIATPLVRYTFISHMSQ